MVLTVWAAFCAVLAWAGAGAWWAVASAGDVTTYLGLVSYCVSAFSVNSCFWVTGLPGTAIAGVVLLCIAGLFAFIQFCVLLSSCCCGQSGRGGASPALAVFALACAIAGTACGGAFFTLSVFESLQQWSDFTNSRPGFALAVTSCVALAIDIVLAVIDSCCCSRAAKPEPAYAADPSTFSGSNPNRV